MILEEEVGTDYMTLETMVRSSYSFRNVEGFFEFLGLAKVEPISTQRSWLRQSRVKKLPLLEAVFKFNV